MAWIFSVNVVWRLQYLQSNSLNDIGEFSPIRGKNCKAKEAIIGNFELGSQQSGN